MAQEVTESALYRECEEIYDKGGQYAVWDFITDNHPEIIWDYCPPCESESPAENGTCLVCGSATKPITPEMRTRLEQLAADGLPLVI
jgi:hypothetical protein